MPSASLARAERLSSSMSMAGTFAPAISARTADGEVREIGAVEVGDDLQVGPGRERRSSALRARSSSCPRCSRTRRSAGGGPPCGPPRRPAVSAAFAYFSPASLNRPESNAFLASLSSFAASCARAAPASSESRGRARAPVSSWRLRLAADGGGGVQVFGAPSGTVIFSVTGFMPSRESVTRVGPGRELQACGAGKDALELAVDEDARAVPAGRLDDEHRDRELVVDAVVGLGPDRELLLVEGEALGLEADGVLALVELTRCARGWRDR